MNSPILEQKEYENFRESLRSFIVKKVKSHASLWENKEFFPAHLLKDMGKKGYLGLSIPKKDGGQGKSFWYEVVLAEELATSNVLGWALSIIVQTNMLAPFISELGSSKQVDEILKPALQGKFYLALGVTEVASGSDVSSIQTEAIQNKDFYIINGEKKYISNGSVAKYIITSVRTQANDNIWSLGFLAIPSNTKGLKCKKLETTGLKSGDTASIIFNNCTVNKKYLLGKPNKGFYYMLKGLQRERLIGAVAVNSLTSYVLDETIKFLKQKERFGEPLSKKQAIRHKITEMKAKLEASRQFAYAACDSFAKGKSVDQDIVMIKIFTYETCQDILKECAHLHGAESFLKSHWLSHVIADSQAFTLAAGTSEVMKDMLAGMLQM